MVTYYSFTLSVTRDINSSADGESIVASGGDTETNATIGEKKRKQSGDRDEWRNQSRRDQPDRSI